MFRLRDLDRTGRLAAAAIALLLVLIPFVAAAVNHGRWIPQGDDALIEVRARDVGTARNPLVGQPSTSGSYGEQADNVAHPGPIEFEALALPIRLFGPTTGFLLTTASVVAACLVVAAWAVFRQVGARGACLAAALLGLACFSAGAAGVVEPISSNAGRFPLLAAAVLVWALLCGDLRLTPLAVAVWSYGAQQHLSVLPAAAVVAAVGALAVGWWTVRGDRSLEEGPDRRHRLVWAGSGVVVGIVLWAPVWWQQLTGHPGNLTALRSYSGDSARQDVGLRNALGQVAHVIGVPPFLGRSGTRGWDLVAHVGTLQVVATLVVVAGLLGAGAWWARADRRLVAAVAMVGALAAAGIVTGTNIPDSPEQGRLAFYHWAFALSFFELLVLVWFAARLAPIVAPKVTHGRRVTAFAVAAVVLLGVTITPLVADRAGDHLNQPIATSAIRGLVHEVRSSSVLRRAKGGPILVLVDGDDRYIQVGDTVAARLLAAGYDARLPPSSKGFAHPGHLLSPCDAPHVLVISLVRDVPSTVPGRSLAAVDAAPSLDPEALGRLVAASTGSHVELGDDLQHALDALPADQGHLIGATLAFRLGRAPLSVLLNRANLSLLIDHPLALPKLAHADLVALRDSLPEGATTVPATGVEAHLLTPKQFAAYRPDAVAGC